MRSVFKLKWRLGGGTHSDARCGPCNMTEADCSPDCRPGVQATTTWLFFGFAGAPGLAGNVGEVGESIVPRGSAFVFDVAGTGGPDLRRGRRRRGVSRTSDGDGQRNRRSRATASYRYARFASDALWRGMAQMKGGCTSSGIMWAAVPLFVGVLSVVRSIIQPCAIGAELIISDGLA